MTVLLVAHGTRNPHGVALIGDLACAMRERLDVDVSVAFVDVLGPSPSEALARLNRETTVVPAFLGRGYHVRRDIPEHLSRLGLPPTRVTDSLGPSDEVLAALVDRLDEGAVAAGTPWSSRPRDRRTPWLSPTSRRSPTACRRRSTLR